VEIKTAYSGFVSSEAQRGVLLNKRLVSEQHRGHHFLGSRGWVSRVSGLYDFGVEPIMLIGSVLHCTGGSVGFHETVLTLNNISVSLLRLFLDVTSVLVIHSILKFVFRVSLRTIKRKIR
jgi:hypothetical protein